MKEHLFCIDTDKNLSSYFNTVKRSFVIILPISCKKHETSLTFIRFSKRIEDKRWLGEGLGRRDR